MRVDSVLIAERVAPVAAPPPGAVLNEAGRGILRRLLKKRAPVVKP